MVTDRIWRDCYFHCYLYRNLPHFVFLYTYRECSSQAPQGTRTRLIIDIVVGSFDTLDLMPNNYSITHYLSYVVVDSDPYTIFGQRVIFSYDIWILHIYMVYRNYSLERWEMFFLWKTILRILHREIVEEFESSFPNLNYLSRLYFLYKPHSMCFQVSL